jgi:hypothetical protein
MIVPSDADYQETKRIKKAGAPLPSPFKELADWIAGKYGVSVLNICFDTIPPNGLPRLSVVLEWEEDALKFRHGRLGNFDSIKQGSVRDRFEEIVTQQDIRGFNVTRLLVVFCAFEPVARIEANESITNNEIERLKAKLSNEDLWDVSRCFDTVTFFFYTDAQVRHYEAEGLRDVFTREYAKTVEPYDEFGYLQKNGVTVRIDSKENFDTNYQSNWYYYYK